MDQPTAKVPAELNVSTIPTVSVHPRWLPGFAIVAVYWIVFWPVKAMTDSSFLDFPSHLIGSIAAGLFFLTAWLGFSRRPWKERLSGLGLFVATSIATATLCDHTMKIGLLLHALPAVLMAWSVWEFATRKNPSLLQRQVLLAATMAITSAYFCLLRLEDIDGSTHSRFSWRWTETAEQQFLNSLKMPVTPAPSIGFNPVHQLTLGPDDWPGFRGPNRDGIAIGPRISTDWSLLATARDDLAASDWPRLVIVGDCRQPTLYAGTTWRQRVCDMLRRGNGG